MSTTKPYFVDNREGNTLAAAVRAYLSHELDTRREPPAVWVATSYFKPDGFPLVAEVLEQAREVRLLLGAEPEPRPPRPRNMGETAQEYQANLVNEGMRALQDGLTADRDLLGFTCEVDQMLRRLIQFLHRDNVQVRLYRRQFLHGKAYIFPDAAGVIVGSSNFTAGGLERNLELNLGRYDPEPVEKVKQWFEDLWQEAEQFDLASIYEARFEPYDPYLIYLRVLWEVYGEEDREEEGGLELTDFQKDGLVRARRILRNYHGVLIADGVGLGKTYIGGELIRQAIYEQRQRALLIAPAALRDGTWDAFFSAYNIKCEAISYEQLAQERALGGNGDSYLRFAPEEYSLIVIDEAQAFRNPGTRRAEALRRLLSGDPPKQVVMLSATPVNNSLWDLYYLLNYFLPHDAVFAHRGILSLKKRFQEAAAVDPFELRPDVLFDVLDCICVRRTRHFVRKWYPNACIKNHRGEPMAVRFPKPRVSRVEYHFGEVLPGFLDELEKALMPDEGEPLLTMARYCPSRYRLAGAQSGQDRGEEIGEPQERVLTGLLRSALLKRFESSAHAFAVTTHRMAQAHESFLRALEAGFIARAQALEELEDVDSDEALEELLRASGQESSEGHDVDALQEAVRQDHERLVRFHDRATTVRPEDDPKLRALCEELKDIVRRADEQGLDDNDRRNRRKVIIFSYYADTVDWIVDYLQQACQQEEELACYAGRIAAVTSDDSRGGVSRREAIYGFAPESTDAPRVVAMTASTSWCAPTCSLRA